MLHTHRHLQKKKPIDSGQREKKNSLHLLVLVSPNSKPEARTYVQVFSIVYFRKRSQGTSVGN